MIHRPGKPLLVSRHVEPYTCTVCVYVIERTKMSFFLCMLIGGKRTTALLTTRKEITKPLASLLPPAPPFPTTLLSSKQQFVGSCRCVHVAGAHPSSAHVLHLENMPHIL